MFAGHRAGLARVLRADDEMDARCSQRPSRVLVAEDDPEMRRLLAEALRADGYEVKEASDGGRLLVDLTRGVRSSFQGVDLIVSDIKMPVCSGLQIVEAIRSTRCEIPIILMTAFGDDATRTQAALFDALLFDKPFAVDDLLTAVARLLPRERRA
jgi:CheY-like chemotaxis protein